MHKALRSVLLMISMTVLVGGMGAAYAEIVSTPEDEAIIVVLVASLVGSLLAPILGWAGSKEKQPFDGKQYIRALILLIPASVTVISVQVEILNVEILTLQAVIGLFIITFLQAVGINSIKAGVAHRRK